MIVARHEVPGYRCREATVLEGRSKSSSVLEIFVVKTELMPLQDTRYLFKSSGAMMFDLIWMS